MDIRRAGKPIEVLLVEDNPGDVRLTLEAFKDSKLNVHLSVAGNGVEALAFLRREGTYHDSPCADMILLDLNLPIKGGRDVLAEIKADEALRRIPVIVLTVSEAQEDILSTYNLHANCYVAKPLALDQFIDVVRSIEDFWFTIVKLPPE